MAFFNTHFDTSSHVFVFRKKALNKTSSLTTGATRTIITTNIWSFLYRVLPLLVWYERIFIHYFTTGPMLFFWLIGQFLLRKTTWVVWGDDVYWYQTRVHSMKNYLYEMLRRTLLPRIPRVVAVIPGDFEYLKKRYHIKAGYRQALYPLPTDFEMLESIRLSPPIPTGVTKILIGNSGCPFNFHLETIALLKRFDRENIRIHCPLAYGGLPEYQERVIAVGRDAFGDRFIPILDQMLPQDYCNYLNDINIAIMNHRRQQGLGNIIPLLFLGKKVFLRGETTSFSFFQNIGVRVFDTRDIGRMEFTEFTRQIPNDGEANYQRIRDYFDEQNIVQAWYRIITE